MKLVPAFVPATPAPTILFDGPTNVLMLNDAENVNDPIVLFAYP